MKDFSKLFQKNSKDKNTSLLRVFGKTEPVVRRVSFRIHTIFPAYSRRDYSLKR
jgi:hypothetical protein